MADPIALLTHAIARWNAGDLAGYLKLYDPRIRLHGYSPEPMDAAAVGSFYRMIWMGLAARGKPNPVIEIADVFAAGPRLACRAVMTGEHMGPFMGHAATGRAYVLPVITILHFEGDRAIERWSQADMLGLLVQIGAVPPLG